MGFRLVAAPSHARGHQRRAGHDLGSPGRRDGQPGLGLCQLRLPMPRSPIALLPFVGGEGSFSKIDYRKNKGTLIVTALLEDLDAVAQAAKLCFQAHEWEAVFIRMLTHLVTHAVKVGGAPAITFPGPFVKGLQHRQTGSPSVNSGRVGLTSIRFKRHQSHVTPGLYPSSIGLFRVSTTNPNLFQAM